MDNAINFQIGSPEAAASLTQRADQWEGATLSEPEVLQLLSDLRQYQGAIMRAGDLERCERLFDAGEPLPPEWDVFMPDTLLDAVELFAMLGVIDHFGLTDTGAEVMADYEEGV